MAQVTEYLFQWVAVDAARDRICDAGVVWAVDEDRAIGAIPMIVGGPYRAKIEHVDARKVVSHMVAGKAVYVTREANR